MAGTTSIEDILSSEVDENALSALIGSLESKVASGPGDGSPGESQDSSSNSNHVSHTPVSSASTSEKQPMQKSVQDNNTTHGRRNSATGTGKKSNSGVKSSASSTPSNSHVNKESGGATVVIKDSKGNTKSVANAVNVNNSSNSNSKTNSTPTSCVRVITLPTSSGGQVLATAGSKNTTVTVSNSRTQQHTSSGPVKVVTAQGLQSVVVPTTTLQPVPTTAAADSGQKMTVREQLAKQQVVVTKSTIVTTNANPTTPHMVLQPAPSKAVPVVGTSASVTPIATSVNFTRASSPAVSTGRPKVVTVNVAGPNSSMPGTVGMPGQQVIMSNMIGGTLPTTVKNIAPHLINQPLRIAGHQMIAPRPGAPAGSGQIQVRLPPGTNLPPNVVLINNKDGSLQAVQVGGTIAQPGTVPGTVTYRHVQQQPGGQFIAPRGPTPIIQQQQVIQGHHGIHGKPGQPVVVSASKPGQPNMTIVSKQMVYTTPGGARTVGPVTVGVPPQMSHQVSHPAGQPSTSGGGAPLQIPMSQSAIENVKKCKNFLTTLIKLASNANQAPETVQNVKDLVQNLIDGRVEPEEFTQKLQKELHSSPQPYLVPFLKKSLPLLRQTLQRSGATTLQGINPQALQTAAAANPAIAKVSKAATVTVGSHQKHALISTMPTGVQGGTPGKTTISVSAQQLEQIVQKHGKAGYHQLQQLAAKAKAQGQPQGQLVTTTIGGQTKTIFLPHHAIIGAQAQVQAAAAAGKSINIATPKAPSSSAKPKSGGTPSRKNQGKGDGGGTPGASFKEDDDINDVASMAGVNLSEESARIMATNADFIGTQMRSIKEEKFLIQDHLHHHVNRLCQKNGLQNASSEVMDLISLATQERLKLLTEKLCTIAAHRMEVYRNDSRFEVTSDVKTQLKVFEQLDSLERKRRDEQEREILMRAAKSRSKQEDPEQLKLKQRAKEMQAMELEQMRQKEANLTALAAIGSRKKRKVDSPTPGSAGSVPGGSGQATASPYLGNFTPTGSTSRRRPIPRIKRVNLRDVLFLLEQEREMKKSQLLFKSFLK